MANIKRRTWFLLHGWLSLPVWLVFCFVCLTGTLSVISHELTWLTNPAARAENPDNLPARPLPDIIAAVKQKFPDADIGYSIVFEPYLVTAVNFSSKQHPNALAYVNPYTAEIQEINGGITFITFMRSLHGWLLFPWVHSYSIGYYLVSAMSVVVLGALITGVIVYKRFWQAFTRPRIRTNKDSRTLLGDIHRLAGAWSIWFLLVIGLTGSWYLVQAVMWHNGIDVWDHPKPVEINALPITDGSPPVRIPFEVAFQNAQKALPPNTPAWISFPEHSRDFFSIAGKGDGILYDQHSYRAFVNPWTGEVVELRRPDTMNTLQTLSHIADPLHYGTFGGLWTKAIWFVFGAILTGMSITGFMIWSKRTFKLVDTHAAVTKGRKNTLKLPAGEVEGAQP